MIRSFWIDVVIGTLFIFGFMGAIDSISAFRVFDVFDPVGDALADMETTDIVFSQMRERPDYDNNIVLVNISTLPREGIAEMVRIVNTYKPSVIGMDSFFYDPKDSLGDAYMEEVFRSVDNLVLVSKLIYNPEVEDFDYIETSIPRFSQHAELGFANLITGAEQQNDLKVCRSFAPKEDVNGETQLSLAVRLALHYDPEKTNKYLERNNEIEFINYRGNVLDDGLTKYGTRYFALDVDDVFTENFVPEIITDKIVIFCFLGESLGDPLASEDKFFTPLNATYAGKASLDMFGGVIHANIISNILDEDHIDAMSEGMGMFWAIFGCFINVAIFSLIYKKIPRWYDGMTKLIQLVEIMVLFYIIILVFDVYNYRLNLTLAILAVALSGDLLEVYYGVIKNSFTREGRRELFQINKM